MINLEAEIGQGEEPAEKGERAVEVVIRNRVQAARAFEEREVVCEETDGQQNGARAAGEFLASHQITKVRAEAQAVSYNS